MRLDSLSPEDWARYEALRQQPDYWSANVPPSVIHTGKRGRPRHSRAAAAASKADRREYYKEWRREALSDTERREKLLRYQREYQRQRRAQKQLERQQKA